MGQMRIQATPIEGVFVLEPALHGDARGWFMETYNQNDLWEAGIETVFVQDNQSRSRRGVLRGLHYQKEHPQAKLVRVLRGEVFDVCVDLRAGSATFGRWFGLTLTEENRLQLYIPQGFAHGFLVLSDVAEFAYKCSDVYHPEDEGGLLWNNSKVSIDWPGVTMDQDGEPMLSDGTKLSFSARDLAWPGLEGAYHFPQEGKP